MNIGIVGPISKDKVEWPNGDTVSKYGAVAYSANVLAKLLAGTEDKILCLSHICENDVVEVRRILNHPNIRMVGMTAPDITGAQIDLKYVNQHERLSHQTRCMTPVFMEELEALAKCEYILLMPLNETDISLHWLQELRKRSSATIFLDIHGLITGTDNQGNRYRKNWQSAAEWLKYIDILKMNDKEASWAAGRHLAGFSDFLQYALSVIESGVNTCWITFGNQSSLVAWRRQERLLWATVPVTDAGTVVDTIGCGDSASAGFIYAYARLHSSLIAVVMGNMIGSVKACIYETEDFPTRPEVRKLIYEHYREYFHKLLDDFLSQKHVIVNEVREEHSNENIVYGPNGYQYGYGADNAGSGHSPGITTPRS